jgi:PEGA domain
MSMRRMTVVLAFMLFVVAMCANAADKNSIRITVLDSETRSSAHDNNGVPQNCEQLTFDAYCRSTTAAPVISTLTVREDNEPPFRIRCTIDSRFSTCTPLPKGESFDARREKRGIIVYYENDKGKARKHLYTLVDADAKSRPPASAAAVATQPVPEATAPRQISPASAPAPSPAVAVAPPAVAVQQIPSEKGLEKVRCKFSSTPAGAEITVDGKYVGSTPSEIPLATGTHVVVFSMPAFAQWKRDLTVTAGSELTVSAALQKE